MPRDDRTDEGGGLPRRLQLAVYGCDKDEADLFRGLAPRFGIVTTTTSEAVSESHVLPVPGTRCISVGHASELSRHDLRWLKASGVAYISTRSIGLDHVDLDAAGELGITVENTVYAPDGVADFTLMLILMAIRNATAVLDAAARHDFTLGVRGRDLRDMTVGVVGVGNIGEAVIRRLQGFGCRVLACNLRPTPGVAADLVSLADLLAESDVVTLHLPLNAETRHLIGHAQIGTMKRGAFLINTARGALVDTAALIAALQSGQLGGCALDVLEGEEEFRYLDRTAEPTRNEFVLRLNQLPNAFVMPHVAFHTTRTLSETVEATLANCLTFERNRANDKAQDRDLVRGMLGGA